MIDCLNKELIDRYITSNCTPDEQRKIEVHLATCKTCREHVTSIREEQSEYEKYPTQSMPEISETPPSLQTYVTPSPTAIEGYTILEELPRGGQAVVYKAVQEATHREVAIKVLLQGPYASNNAQLRFEREVDLAAHLRHPNIVTIYDSGIAKGQYFFAMEYIQGKPLDKYVRAEKLSLRDTMILFNKICAAVTYAHQHGVMHRDLKPGNIMVDAEGEPHILDFGLAKLTESSENNSYQKVTTSISGQIFGTLAYMSPEQTLGQPGAVDARTDIYSLGVILYKVLTDSFPYEVTGSMYSILRNITEIEPLKPSCIVPHLNSEAEAILLKALAKNPDFRYQSTAELERDIENWLQGLPVSARSDSSIYLLRKLISRHRYTSTVIALLLVIVLGFSGFAVQIYFQYQKTIIELDETKKALHQAETELAECRQEASIGRFLMAWHGDRMQESQFVKSFFGDGSKEQKAAVFLLDSRSLAEKEDEFRKELHHDEPGFVEFIIAEHHLKDGNQAETLKAYQNCLKYDEDLDSNNWLSNRAQAKIRELTKEYKIDKSNSSYNIRK